MAIALRWILVSCVVMISAPASSEEDDFFREGLYVGIDAVYGFDNFRDQIAATSDSPGASARVGYRLTSIWSAELLAELMDAFDLTRAPTGTPAFTQNVRIWHVSANIKGSVDLTRLSASLARIQPYGVLGVGYYQAWLNGSSTQPNQSVKDGMMRIGAGVDVYATSRLLVAVEGRYNAMFNRRNSLDYWSVSVGPQYRF